MKMKLCRIERTGLSFTDKRFYRVSTGEHSGFSFLIDDSHRPVLMEYNLPTESFVSITILNSDGAPVRRLQYGMKEKGHHTLSWNGCDIAGIRLLPGEYFCHIEFNGTVRDIPFHLR